MFILPLQDNFQCLIDIEGRQTKVSASVRQSRVICGETEYSYREARGETAAQLTVLWNRDTFIGRTNVTLYKCSLLGSHGGRGDCSLCASRDPKYECTWCSGHCTYGPTCNEPVQMTCPPPRIDWVSDRFRTCVEYLFGYWPTLGLQYLIVSIPEYLVHSTTEVMRYAFYFVAAQRTRVRCIVYLGHL